MPAYAYPINIDRHRKTINYTVEHPIGDGRMTIDDLDFLNGETFTIWIDAADGSPFDIDTVVISVFKSRLETMAERRARVKKEIRYMREYNRRKTESKN